MQSCLAISSRLFKKSNDILFFTSITIDTRAVNLWANYAKISTPYYRRQKEKRINPPTAAMGSPTMASPAPSVFASLASTMSSSPLALTTHSSPGLGGGQHPHSTPLGSPLPLALVAASGAGSGGYGHPHGAKSSVHE